MRKRRTNEERLALQLSMMLWAFEHQPATMSEVADQFGLDIDDAYSELYPLQGVEVLVNDEFHNLGLVVDEDGEIFFDINPLFGRPRKLERSEALGLLAVAKAALTLPGTDAAALRTGVNKLEQALGIDSAMAVELPEPEHLLVLQQATANKEIIRIDYYAQWTDALSSRVVEPFETVNVSGDWYLRGHCRLRDAHRTFRVDRIEGVELTGEAHSRSDPGYEAFTGGDAAPVVKLNVPIGLRWMIESLPADFVDEGGRISVEMPTSSTVFLERLLLSLGADTHVDPDEFEQIRSEAARRLLERYDKN